MLGFDRSIIGIECCSSCCWLVIPDAPSLSVFERDVGVDVGVACG